MRTAFKEWAVVVDALMHGGQIVIVRKGGLREGKGGFQVEHPEFLLFPTLFHQQRESVIPAAQSRYDSLAPHFPAADILRIEGFAKVVEWRRLSSLQDVQRLRGQHIWREDVLAERFDWGREKQVHALAVRVFRLDTILKLPMQPGYGGCKSWVELETEIDVKKAHPVLDETAFAGKLKEFDAALPPAP